MDTDAIEVARGRHSYTRASTRIPSAITLVDQLHGLRRSTFPELVVSAYLPVAAETRWGQPADALRDLAEERRLSLDADARRALERELPRMREALERDWRGSRAVAVFSSLRLRIAAGLLGIVVPQFVVARRAELRALDEELRERPASLAVVADKEGGRIYAAVLDRVSLLAEVEALPVHHHRQGGTSAEQWQRRQEGHADHNLALLAHRLEAIWSARRDDFPVIRVAVPPEALEMLVSHLPSEMQARVRHQGGLPAYATDEEVERVLVDR